LGAIFKTEYLHIEVAIAGPI